MKLKNRERGNESSVISKIAGNESSVISKIANMFPLRSFESCDKTRSCDKVLGCDPHEARI